MIKFDLDFEVSIFENAKKTEVVEDIPISNILQDIAEGRYKKVIERLRDPTLNKQKADDIKRLELPMLAMHGKFETNREKKDFFDASGLIIIDIDDIDGDLEEIKDEIMKNNHILSCFISPSGNGIKVLYLVDKSIVDKDTYRIIGKKVSKEFMQYGIIDVLSVTDCLIATFDSKMRLNLEVSPDLSIKKPKIEKKIAKNINLERDESREIYDDPEEFFEKVLFGSIKAKSSNNYDFIQMAVFDLARFGFKSPEYDLDFVIDFSEVCHKESSENAKRLRETCLVAESMEQEKIPYKTFGERKNRLEPTRKKVKEIKKQIEEEHDDDWDGLEDYSNVHEEVQEVFDRGDRSGIEISLPNFSNILRFDIPDIVTLIGIPTHGKGEIIDTILLDLFRLFNIGTLVVGWEQTKAEHIWKLARKFLGYFPKKGKDRNKKDEATTLITSKIKHLNVDEIGGNIDDILFYAEKAIKRHNLQCMVLDPFNLISTDYKGTEHGQANDILKKIVMFSKKQKVLVFIVVHPTKMQIDEKTGKFKKPNLYNAKNTSAFYEMTYDGFNIYRDDDNDETPISVKNLKVKQNIRGTQHAEAYFKYHKPSGRLIPVDADGEEFEGDWLARDWIEKYKEKFLK